MFTTRFPALLLGVAVLAASGCRQAAPARQPAMRLRLVTGPPGGGFLPMGKAMAPAFASALPAIQLDLIETEGAVANVEALQNGTADIGFAFADVAYVAYVGRPGSSHPVPFDRLRGVAVLQTTPLHLMVRGDSNIRAVAELRGRRVGLGPPGSGTAVTADLVLREFGIGPDAFHGELLPFNAQAARLADGTLDAMFVNSNYPAESVRIAARAGAHLLPVSGEGVERLRRDYPFLRLTKIPGGTYPGHPDSVHTIGADSLLLCRRDLNETVVYDLTRRFFETLATVSAAHESMRMMDLEQAPATPIPLHEGAARYYRERELFR